jgi:hypothetical protein
MKIEIGKFYKDREGNKIRIYALDGGLSGEIHGAQLIRGMWQLNTWNNIGKYHAFNTEDAWDIVSEWGVPRRSPVVPPGEYYLHFPIERHVIEVSPVKYEDVTSGQLDYTQCVYSSDGYFEGNSMEDVRFIQRDPITAQIENFEGLSTWCQVPGSIVATRSCCGAPLDSHKPECPENKEINKQKDFYFYDDLPGRYLGMPERNKCECGSDFLGSPKHSSWCPKYEDLA